MLVARHRGRWSAAAVLLASLLGVLVGAPAHAQQINLAEEAFIMPPKEIADVVLSPRGAAVPSYTNISPDGKKFLVTKTEGMTDVARMGKSHVYLGEMAFDHIANRSRNLYVNSSAGYEFFYYADSRTVPVQIPEKTRVGQAAWSPDGSQLAFFVYFEDATHIYIADTVTGGTRRLTTTPVQASLDTNFTWSKDGKRIQTVLLPDDGRRPPPKEDPAEAPKVRVARDAAVPSRTYRYLLDSVYDMKLLEHLATGQLALIDVADGKVTKVGSPDMIRTVSAAPGEELFRITTMKKPFSYTQPASSFGTKDHVVGGNGQSLYTFSDRSGRGGGGGDKAKADPAQAKGQGKDKGKGGQGKGKGKGGKGANKGQPPANPPVDPNQPPPDPTDPDAPPQPAPQPPVDANGRREVAWRPDGAGYSFLQLEPEGKDAKAARKDRVMTWVAPFGENDVKSVYETPNRMSGLMFSADCKMLFMVQTIENERKLVAVDLAEPTKPYILSAAAAAETPEGGRGGGGGGDGGEVLDPNAPDFNNFDLGYGDGVDYRAEQQRGGQRGGGQRGGAPGGGTLVTKPNRGSVGVVRVSTTGDVYVTGSDRSGGAARPFIDKINIKTAKKTRIFEGKGDLPETINQVGGAAGGGGRGGRGGGGGGGGGGASLTVDGDDITHVFTTRQRSDVAPNTFMYELASGKITQMTNNTDHNPWFHEIRTQTITATRADGFRFRIRVTLPPNAPPKMPALFWFYPREYTSQAAYDGGRGGGGGGGGGGGRGGPNFSAPGPRAMQMWTRLGYALIEPDCPIVGPEGRMNDNYVNDLRNNLWATIDELDKRGIIDRDRLAIGGHSYGGFSTANALAHTPFFKAGIAGDGCYNRTLTPMSFQSERRHLWDAREMYLEMSPMLWANHVNGALLMYHSMEDANVGTNPINAEFMYMCLQGLGKPASLYMYPYEGHGPIAKETVLDQWARWVGWLDKYVKNPKKPTPAGQ